MKRMIALLLCLTLLVPFAACAEKRVYQRGEVMDFPEGERLMDLYVAPLLAADAMVLVCDGVSMAIDMGKYNQDQDVLKLLDSLGIQRLDGIFNTLPVGEHAAGIIKVLESGKVRAGTFMTAFPDEYLEFSSVQNQLIPAVKRAGIPIQRVQDGTVFYVGGAKVTCLQYLTSASVIDNSSCMLFIEYGNCKLMLTSDGDSLAQGNILKRHPELTHVDIMKAPHHGMSPLNIEFMQVMEPEFVFITGGSGDAKPACDQLYEHDVPIAFASRGPIHLSCNGNYWIVEQELAEQFR